MLSEKLKSSKDYIEIEDHLGAHNYHPLDVVIRKAKGIWVWDVDGNKYMDCLASYSAVNQGHCHPKILKALTGQARQVTLTSRAFRNDKLPLLYQKLYETSCMTQFLLMNSGAEAIETAVKAARKWGYTKKGIPDNQAEIIVAANNFHGRTTTVISFSTEAQYRDGFGPFTPGFKVVPFGDTEALKKAITPNTAAFLVEPIQAEAGIIIPPEGYLKGVEKICKDNNVLLILDEIQTGFGRTGRFFCHYYDSVVPDMIVVGKALSGGYYPVSAVLSTPEILGVFKPGDHGSTFGGNPLGCAVSVAALNVILEEKLDERSAELGAYFLEKLKAINHPKIKEVRGRGLLIGFELKEKARPLVLKLQELGILCKDTHETTIRFTPPLIITRAEIDWAVERIEKALNSI
ncbi:MAG: ornithine--oxo-acid transaminase [Bacteroidetes bacterium]|nr:ornithine--oxo-acid transaminase [Bacteroidota bacterium]